MLVRVFSQRSSPLESQTYRKSDHSYPAPKKISLRGDRPPVLCRLRKESEEQSVLLATWRSPTAFSMACARSSADVNELTWPPPLASHR